MNKKNIEIKKNCTEAQFENTMNEFTYSCNGKQGRIMNVKKQNISISDKTKKHKYNYDKAWVNGFTIDPDLTTYIKNPEIKKNERRKIMDKFNIKIIKNGDTKIKIE